MGVDVVAGRRHTALWWAACKGFVECSKLSLGGKHSREQGLIAMDEGPLSMVRRIRVAWSVKVLQCLFLLWMKLANRKPIVNAKESNVERRGSRKVFRLVGQKQHLREKGYNGSMVQFDARFYYST